TGTLTAAALTPVTASARAAVATAPLASTAGLTPLAAIFPALVLVVAAWSRLSLFAAFRSWAGATLARHLLVALSHRRPTRQPDAPFFIHAQAFHQDFIAQLDDVLGLLDPEVGQLADVDQAVPAREKFDERPEFLDGDNFAAVDLADLGLGGHAGDGVAGNLHSLFGHRVDIDGAVVLDVDFAAGFLDQLLDVFAAWTDQRADLLRVYLDCLEARRVLAQLLAWRAECLGHLCQDQQPGIARALHRLGHQAVRHAGQLQVKLEAGDALFGPGDFAIHIAEGIFPADNIGQQLILRDAVLVVVLGAQADADAGDRTPH